ncbi:MAG: hypothetical protein AAF800_11885 [Planctomycetota bacterium]
MLRNSLGVVGALAAPALAMAGPPTVGPQTTYYQGPLDDEGYVDYVAALNAAFGDADAEPRDNAFLGVLDHLETADWSEGHVPALYAALGAAPAAEDRPRFRTFYDHANALGLPSAPPFDWDNAGPDDEPPPPPPGTADAMAERAAAAPWTDDDLPEVARWLDSIRAPLDAIVEATRRTAYFAPLVRPHPEAVVIEVLLPHLGTHRDIARSLDMRVRRHLGRDDLDAAIADWAAMKRLSRLQQREPILISNLVGLSIQSLSHDAFTVIVSQPGLTAAHVAEMREVLDDLPEGVGMAEVMQRAERVASLDLMTQASRGRVRVLDMFRMMQSLSRHEEPTAFFVNDPGPDPITGLISDPDFKLNRALRRINTAWDRWFGDLPADYAEFAARQEHAEAAIDRLRERSRQNISGLIAIGHTGIPDGADPGPIADATADLLLGLFCPSLIAAVRTERQSQAQAALEPVALALAAYRIDHGRYPPLLQSLTPAYLHAVPADPLGKNSLRYQRRDGGYLLYSVGTNLTDDGGRHDFRDGDIALSVPRMPSP